MKAKEIFLYSQLKHRPNREAFIKAYDLYVDQIYRFIYFKVGNREEAEDLTSSVFLKTWHYLEKKRLEASTIRALLYKVARNAVIDYYRRKSEEVPLSENQEVWQLPDDSNQPAEEIDQAAQLALLRQKLNQLKEEYRDVIIMKYIDDLSVGEIAEALGKTKGNVRVLVHRALKALKELVENSAPQKGG